MSNQFEGVAIQEGNPKWEESIQRQGELYHRKDDVRSPFARDYNRILHSNAYRRLKHKTQVFFAPRNDHICTRIEHVNHVSAVSYTITKHLGLNTELAMAIATGHDVGHAPFGHFGETVIKEMASGDLEETFWHERNSLRFVDRCETLTGPDGSENNLNLTYAVRDGIISHCGEVDYRSISPREEDIDLETIEKANQYPPYTWEGCVVKVADKIAYLGRDIEDAMDLKILTQNQMGKLNKIVEPNIGQRITEINNTAIMHNFVIDICSNSSPQTGIRMTRQNFNFIKELREFSNEYIYRHERLYLYKDYARMIIESIYTTLKNTFNGERTMEEIESRYLNIFPTLAGDFIGWLKKHAKDSNGFKRDAKYKSIPIYNLSKEEDYLQAIIDFISGMTDIYAIRIFGELTSF